MWVFVYALLVTGALGHYQLYDPRSIQNDLEPRQEPFGAGQGKFQVVKCPVCESSNSNLGVESCSPGHSKICRYGVYRNPGCGRPDCFRGEGELCAENPNAEGFVARCAPGYDCQFNRCVNPLVTQHYNVDRIHEQLYRLKQSPVLWNDN
ncbi:hypothetical protein O0L34_g776 [Tuta absoluta]|nr:hypothetical protein O0L34_g776 [Tuta absoluta]